MNPLLRLLGAAASHGLLTGQIVFSTAFVGACELPQERVDGPDLLRRSTPLADQHVAQRLENHLTGRQGVLRDKTQQAGTKPAGQKGADQHMGVENTRMRLRAKRLLRT
jgi:hypothetical protein